MVRSISSDAFRIVSRISSSRSRRCLCGGWLRIGDDAARPAGDSPPLRDGDFDRPASDVLDAVFRFSSFPFAASVAFVVIFFFFFFFASAATEAAVGALSVRFRLPLRLLRLQLRLELLLRRLPLLLNFLFFLFFASSPPVAAAAAGGLSVRFGLPVRLLRRLALRLRLPPRPRLRLRPPRRHTSFHRGFDAVVVRVDDVVVFDVGADVRRLPVREPARRSRLRRPSGRRSLLKRRCRRTALPSFAILPATPTAVGRDLIDAPDEPPGGCRLASWSAVGRRDGWFHASTASVSSRCRRSIMSWSTVVPVDLVVVVVVVFDGFSVFFFFIFILAVFVFLRSDAERLPLRLFTN